MHTSSSGSTRGGFLMIETFDITDFRCFEHVHLEGLARINVVTGQNGSGKSALLEALYVAANATAASIQNIAAMRSQGPVQLNLAQGIGLMLVGAIPAGNLAAYFDPLFRSYKVSGQTKAEDKIETSKQISFSYKDSEQISYRLSIAYQSSVDQTPVPVPLVRAPGGQAGIVPVIFDREKKTPLGPPEHMATPVTTAPTGQLQQPVTRSFGPATFIFGANMDYVELDSIAWFSQLKERNEADKLISWVQKEFPFITGLEVLAPSGPTGLYAVMPDGARRRLTSVSSGIYKIISILLAAVHTHNGIIVIDEIENGIFYGKYPAVWRVLYDFAKATGNQIFVSSHSSECLAALPDVIGDATKDFCLLRTERDNGDCIVRHISGVAMKAALRGGNEIRGAVYGLDRVAE